MALRVGTEMPSLEGATQWFNEEICAEALRGHAVLDSFLVGVVFGVPVQHGIAATRNRTDRNLSGHRKRRCLDE